METFRNSKVSQQGSLMPHHENNKRQYIPKDEAPWKKLPGMSLRNRIAFYYTVATAFLIAIVFTFTYLIVESVVYKQFDEKIRTEILEILTKAHIKTKDFKGFASFQELDNTESIDTEFVQVVNSTGEMVKKSSTLSWCALAFNPKQPAETYFNNSFVGSVVRQAQIPLVNRKGVTEGYLIVAVPLKNAIIVLQDLRNVFLYSFPGIIVTLFIFTRMIAGKSIRPIEKVIATAERMTQENLHQRIALPFHHDELYRLSSTINDLLDRLQKAFQREKQFTADASHELKTPLSTVKGTLEVLIRKPREKEHYETKIQFCLVELNRMAKLIDQLLMLARYESSAMKPNIETIALLPHIEEVVARMKVTAIEKNIAIRIQQTESLNVAADPAILEMIFVNILSNAIKYSPGGSSITIAVERKANTIVCSIADQGIGIPAEKIHAVFERFYRVDTSRNSGTGGTGLGLSIVKKLADLQKITVSLKSEKNMGTTFVMVFPSA
jgi:heavy metal sensor kinase